MVVVAAIVVLESKLPAGENSDESGFFADSLLYCLICHFTFEIFVEIN